MGKPKYYQTTTNIAVQFFFGIVPIHEKLGNSSFEQTLDDFTEDATKIKLRKFISFNEKQPVTGIFYCRSPLFLRLSARS